jgi:hypothetical protein
MIGPAPMIMMEVMSVRLGMQGVPFAAGWRGGLPNCSEGAI